jgi:hypothetical protein
VPMKNLSPVLNDVATMPSCGLMVKKTRLIGPRISSTLPIGVFEKSEFLQKVVETGETEFLPCSLGKLER